MSRHSGSKAARLVPVGFDANFKPIADNTAFKSLIAAFNGGASWQREPFFNTTEANVVGGALTTGTKNTTVAARYSSSQVTSFARGGGWTWQLHAGYCAPWNNNADVVLVDTAGTGDDAKVWSTAKPANMAWRAEQLFASNLGEYFGIVCSDNEPNSNCVRFCAVASSPENVGATVSNFSAVNKIDQALLISRVREGLKSLWDASRVGTRRLRTAVVTPALTTEGSRSTKPTYCAFNIYEFLAADNGLAMTMCDGVSMHAYDEAFRWVTAAEGASNQSPYHWWKAIKAAQALAETGQRHFVMINEWGFDERLLPPALRTVWNHGSDFGSSVNTEVWDAANAPIHHSKLAARRNLKAIKAGLAFAFMCYWAISYVTIYNLWSSPDDGMILAPGGTPREPAWLAYRTAFDLSRYRLTGVGPWPLPITAKPWMDFTDETTRATTGFHNAGTWGILADFSEREISDPASSSAAPYYEWRRATVTDGAITFTAPVAGQGNQTNRAIRPIILPHHGTWKVSATVAGNSGTARLVARGYDKYDGEAQQVASTGGNGRLTVTFTHRPHNHPAVSNLPSAAVVLESTANASFMDVVVSPT